ncbi:MAG: succinate dehydrogenase [Acidaminococcaceae bacterium]|nr:succinate dehydrogenase [Acidaminococcaceae bacterium]
MRIILKILAAPISLMLSLIVRLCAAILSPTAILFGIAGTVLGVLALVVMLTTSVTNGLILLGLALAVSPIGLPMLAVKLLGGLQTVQFSLKRFLKS